MFFTIPFLEHTVL